MGLAQSATLEAARACCGAAAGGMSPSCRPTRMRRGTSSPPVGCRVMTVGVSMHSAVQHVLRTAACTLLRSAACTAVRRRSAKRCRPTVAGTRRDQAGPGEAANTRERCRRLRSGTAATTGVEGTDSGHSAGTERTQSGHRADTERAWRWRRRRGRARKAQPRRQSGARVPGGGRLGAAGRASQEIQFLAPFLLLHLRHTGRQARGAAPLSEAKLRRRMRRRRAPMRRARLEGGPPHCTAAALRFCCRQRGSGTPHLRLYAVCSTRRSLHVRP